MSEKLPQTSPRAFQKFKLVTFNEDFDRDIKKLRRKHGFDEDGFLSHEEKNQWAGRYSPDIAEDLKKLRLKYKLSALYDSALRDYFHYGKIDKVGLPANNLIVSEGGKFSPDGPEYDDPQLNITIFPETSVTDLEYAFETIVEILGKGLFKRYEMPTKIKKRKNLDRDLRVVELERSGKFKPKEIASIVNEEFPNHTSLIYSDIPTIKKRINDFAKSFSEKPINIE